MTREEQLEKDICLLYWRIGSLTSNESLPLWESVKRIIKERNIDIHQDFSLDGIAKEIQEKMNENKPDRPYNPYKTQKETQ